VIIKRLLLCAVVLVLLAQVSPGAQSNDFKWQRAKGKVQVVFHLPFAICPLPFEMPLSGGGGLKSSSSIPTSGSGGEMSFDLRGYTAELERWSALAGHLRDHAEKAPALRRQLPDSWSVVVQEQRFSVSTRPFGAALDRIIRDPREAAKAAQETSAGIEGLLEDARAISQPPIRDYGPARAKLDQILARREFRFARRPAQSETIWDRLQDELRQWVIGLINRAGNHPNVTNFLRWGIVVFLGLVFLVWLFYTLSHASFQRLPAPAAAAPAAPSRNWIEEARSAAARGEFREAIRKIYCAAVLLLGEAGAWDVDPSRTHREYVRLLPAGSARRPHLLAITDCFERSWYGRAQASALDYEAALAGLESLE